jgi:hypothetical protein
MTPRLYRHRPTTVEAAQIDRDNPADLEAIANWCGGDIVRPSVLLGRENVILFVPDLDDDLVGSYAESGDWIVRTPTGAYDVFAPEAFHATYAPVVEL